MRIVTIQEAGEWCLSHSISIDGRGLPTLRDAPGASRFTIPKDAGQRVALVRDQMNALATAASCLVWLDDWSVWPSGQWSHLFDRFRLSYGCQDPLITKPAHLVEKKEFDSAISIAVYAVLMLWDCYVIADNGCWVFYSHDEWGLMKV